MKRTCNGCYAALRDGPTKDESIPMRMCLLRYKNKDGHPLEECPKPRSYIKLCKTEKKNA
nr:MAG TPA: hypothetical protein [Caudoviricetes sp.]